MSVEVLSGLEPRPHGFGLEKLGVPGGDSACKSESVRLLGLLRLSDSGGLGNPMKLSGLLGESSLWRRVS
jgi:hypothetical protein